MMRGPVIALAVIACGALLAGVALGSSSVKATLTHPIQPAPPGTRIAVSWKLRDASGHTVIDKHVFLKITCPEGDVSTTAYANPNSKGAYRVEAVVPAGGVGTITVGHGRMIFPLTNPYHG